MVNEKTPKDENLQTQFLHFQFKQMNNMFFFSIIAVYIKRKKVENVCSSSLRHKHLCSQHRHDKTSLKHALAWPDTLTELL